MTKPVMKDHPLYRMWLNIWKPAHRKKPVLPEESWKDFWTFVRDVEEKPRDPETPGMGFYFKKIDETLPFGKDNFYWKPRIKRLPDETLEECRNRWRLTPAYHSPKCRYGITRQQFEAILAAQHGVCAVCYRKETRYYSKKTRDRVRRLSVDHCHGTGKIRGLLCTACNTAIGALGDNIQTLLRMIEYIQHAQKEQNWVQVKNTSIKHPKELQHCPDINFYKTKLATPEE